MSQKITARQASFHKETTNYICQFFQSCKLPSSTVNHNMFKGLCQHLNPLVQLPTVQKLNSYLESNVSPRHQSCFICGIDDQSPYSLSLDINDAAVFLSVAVMMEEKTIQQAKREMLNDTMVICVEHIRFLHSSMIKIIGISSKTSFDDLPEYQFLGGRAVYSTLINIRRFFKNEPLEEIGEEGYRSLVKNWLLLHMQRFNHQRNFDGLAANSNHSKILKAIHSKENSGPKLRDHETQETESVPSTSSNLNSESNHDVPPNEIKLEEPDMGNVKIEEPDYEEQNPTETHTTPSEYPRASSSTPSLIPSNSTVYTLKNGKKVVKAPANLTGSALANSSGKLVVYRVATRKLFKRAGEDYSQNPESSQTFSSTSTASGMLHKK